MTEPQEQYEYPGPEPVSGKTWLRHLGFLALTFVTSTIAGILYPFGRINTLPEADPQSWPEALDFILSIPQKYVGILWSTFLEVSNDTSLLIDGLSFSLSLLFILLCHEMGHYIACRIYKVDATLPYFIPTPPLVGPAGTFGAFIKIRSPMPSRRAVFDIGVAGPIAGFVALIPIAAIAFATMRFGTVDDIASGNVDPLSFSDPLFMKAMALLWGADLSLPMYLNPFYFATWVGLLVTALNLIPSGQLDGGHAVFAVFGEKVHKWTGRIAFSVMLVLSILGAYYFNSPSGFLIALILAIMMRVGHPTPYDQTPLDAKRKVIAFLTLVIFALCFVPFPIKIS